MHKLFDKSILNLFSLPQCMYVITPSCNVLKISGNKKFCYLKSFVRRLVSKFEYDFWLLAVQLKPIREWTN